VLHPREARAVLENKTFDIILCGGQVQGEMSDQDLLDELRREKVLPYSTVFVMITSEATYARVTEAALDAYLVRPIRPRRWPRGRRRRATARRSSRTSSGPSKSATTKRPPTCASSASTRARSSDPMRRASVRSCCCA